MRLNLDEFIAVLTKLRNSNLHMPPDQLGTQEVIIMCPLAEEHFGVRAENVHFLNSNAMPVGSIVMIEGEIGV